MLLRGGALVSHTAGVLVCCQKGIEVELRSVVKQTVCVCRTAESVKKALV
jgi:hypothetical protein